MSDVGLNFSVLDLIVVGAIIALPLTTLLLGALIWRRVVRRRRGRALDAGIVILGLLWVVPVGLMLALWIDGLIEEMRAAQQHFTLTAERRIDAVALPARAEVTLDGYDRLESVTLPDGVELDLGGAKWRGFIRFTSSLDKEADAPVRVSIGQPAADARFDGVLCRAGQAVSFWAYGGLSSCTLAEDTAGEAGIADTRGGTTTAHFVCAADRILEFQPGRERQVRSCTLASTAEVQDVPCAAGGEVEILGGNLTSCSLADPQRFGGVEIPGGSVVQLSGTPRRLERFLLPAMAAPLSVFGMKLPAHAEVRLCQRDWAVDQVSVPDGAFIEIAGVKLAGSLDFDCGVFRLGGLYEDTPIAGERWAKGRTVFRENLELPAFGRP